MVPINLATINAGTAGQPDQQSTNPLYNYLNSFNNGTADINSMVQMATQQGAQFGLTPQDLASASAGYQWQGGLTNGSDVGSVVRDTVVRALNAKGMGQQAQQYASSPGVQNMLQQTQATMWNNINNVQHASSGGLFGGLGDVLGPALAIGGLAFGVPAAMDALGIGGAAAGAGGALGGLDLNALALSGSTVPGAIAGGSAALGAGGGAMDALSNITNLFSPTPSTSSGLWGSNMNIGDIGNYLGDQTSLYNATGGAQGLSADQAMQAMQAYNNAASGGTWNAFLNDMPLTGVGDTTSTLSNLFQNFPSNIGNTISSMFGGTGTATGGRGGFLGGLGSAVGSAAPGMMALNYAQGLQPIDTSQLQSVFNQAQANAPGFVQASLSPAQGAMAMGYGDLLQSQALRGIRGSSFGDQDIADYLSTQADTLADIGTRAQQQALGLQGQLAGKIAGIGAENQNLKNQMYGRAFNLFGQGLNPSVGTNIGTGIGNALGSLFG